MTAGRPVPVPDDLTAPFWEAAARHELVLPRCERCETLVLPPEIVCGHCGSPDPQWAYEPSSGSGVIRSWTTARQAFLPGFDAPYVLVDVELGDQQDLRLVGRLVDGGELVDRPGAITVGAPVRVAFEDLDEDVAVPVFELVDVR